MTGAQIRLLCRDGLFDQPTAGAAKGFTQANLIVLPSQLANDFETFCRNNPRPCPLLEVLEVGQYNSTISADMDVRTDLPRYYIYKNGECVDQPTSIVSYWPDSMGSSRADWVAFLIGCSFTFESALLHGHIPVRHIEEKCNVPMYRTNIMCTPSGPFHGPMIVSMRPMTPEQAIKAKSITAHYPQVHGEPIHIGDPSAIGIEDISRSDYGDTVTIHDNEVPVFWACGITPMDVIIQAKLELAITHKPGHMLITDLKDQTLLDEPILYR